MIGAFLDHILPGDDTLGLPPGSRVAFADYVAECGIASLIERFLDRLDAVARDTAGHDFQALGEAERKVCVDAFTRRERRLFADVVVHCLKAYYSDAAVLRNLSAGSVPPFPEGNLLQDDDWSILEPVFERGPVFRPVTP